MADLASTRVFGKLTVMHDAVVKGNAEIVGNMTATKFIGNGSGLTGTASLRATGTTKADVGLGSVRNVSSYSQAEANSKFAGTSSTGSAGASLDTYTSNGLYGVWPSESPGKLAGLLSVTVSGVYINQLFAVEDELYIRRSSNSGTTWSDWTEFVPTGRSITAGTGLSGGGTLAANRTLSVKYGTAAGTAAQGNDSRIVNAVPNTRTITAGSGLTGGGTLAANRSIAVDSTVIRTTGTQTIEGVTRFSNNMSSTTYDSQFGTGAAGAGAVFGYHSMGGAPSDSPNGQQTSVLHMGNPWGRAQIAIPNNGGLFYRHGSVTSWARVVEDNDSRLTTNLGSSGTGATRTITSSTGSNTSITYSAADVGAVPTSRTITAGTGLTGGGDLTANRTLSVSYGTAAGTAAQGNDSRLSNSREWTASVVSQAEAEAGTATTARKWTAQRVAQAISALGLKIGTTATTAKAGNWMPTWANVTGKPTTFTPSAHTHTLSQVTDAGNVASINTNASTANYLRGDGTWVTPPNTTYSVISTAEIDAGTASTARTISAARIKYILDKKANVSHTHDGQYYTQSEVDALISTVQSSAVPSGVITMWSGTTSAIPSGWALCDGNNGTPDLRNRFVVGAGSSYSMGDTGGADSVALTVQQLPAHNHTASTGSAGNHSHSGSTGSAGAHTHSLAVDGNYGNTSKRLSAKPINVYANETFNTQSGGAHTHSLSINSNGAHTHTVSVGNTGSGQAHENRPPYYALAYIMKL